MKNFKTLALLSLLSVGLFACSEGTTTPAVNSPYASLQGGMNPYPNGINTQAGSNTYYPNPYLQNPGSAYTNSNPYFQYQAQLMYSTQARLNPYFYYQAYWSNGCGVRRQVTYTPTQCSCVRAPCNCQQVLSQCSQNSTTTSTTSQTNTNTDGIDTNSKTLPLSITGADAKAIYQRLAKEEEDTQNRYKTKIRTGTIIKCMKDGRGKSDEDYACDFDVSVADGKIYEIYPVGKIGQPEIASDTQYSGKALEIGSNGANTNEGILKISGRIAKYLFKKLTGDAKPGTIGIDNATAANIKSGVNLKCYETSATAEPVTECTVKFRVDTGEVLAP